MIPHPWPALVLALGTYRVVRLIGWDDLPPVLRLRRWITGEQSQVSASTNTSLGLTNELPQVVYWWKRPTLAHFLGCAYCQGFWVGLAVYGAWIVWPRPSLYALAPFALNGIVGIVARNLDP